jgi:hypothetical protein
MKLYSNKKTNVEIDQISTLYAEFSFLPVKDDLSLLKEARKNPFLYEKSHFFHPKFIDKKIYKQILNNSNQNFSNKFWIVLNSKKTLLNTLENLKCLNSDLFFHEHLEEKQQNLVKTNQKFIRNFNSNLWSIIEFLNDSSYNFLFFYQKFYLRSCFSNQVHPLVNYSLFLSNFILIFYTICNMSCSFPHFPELFLEAKTNLSYVKKESHLYGKLKAIFSLFLSFPFLSQPEKSSSEQNQNNEKSLKINKSPNLKEESRFLSSLNLTFKNQEKSTNFSTYVEEILILFQKQKFDSLIQFEDYFKLKQYFKKTLFQFYFHPLRLTQFSIKNSFFHQNQCPYLSIYDSIEYLRIANENYFTWTSESRMNESRTQNSVPSYFCLPYLTKEKGKSFAAYEVKTKRESMAWNANHQQKSASFTEPLGVGHFVLKMDINSNFSHFFHFKNQSKISLTRKTFSNFSPDWVVSTNVVKFSTLSRNPFDLEPNLYEKKRNKGILHLFWPFRLGGTDEKNQKLALSYGVIKTLPHTGTGSFDFLPKHKKLSFSMQKNHFLSSLISKIEQYTFSFFISNGVFQLVFDFLQKNQDFETFKVTLLALFEKQNSTIFQTFNNTNKILTNDFLKNHFFFLFQKSYTYKNFRLSKKCTYSSFLKEEEANSKNRNRIHEKNKKLAVKDINENILSNDSFLQEKIIKMHDRRLKLKAWEETYKNQFFLINNNFFYFTKKSFEFSTFLQNIQFLCRKFHFKMFQSHIFHSYFKLLNQKPGFEFEGFYFIQVDQKQNEFTKIQNQLLPSSQKLILYLKELKKIVQASKVQSQQLLIQRLKNSILKWCESNKIISNKKSFYLCDYLLFKWIWKWACRRHSNKSRQWIQKKYYHLFEIFPKNSLSNRIKARKKWHFCFYNPNLKSFECLPHHSKTNLIKYQKIRSNFFIYNQNWKYFAFSFFKKRKNLHEYDLSPRFARK